MRSTAVSITTPDVTTYLHTTTILPCSQNPGTPRKQYASKLYFVPAIVEATKQDLVANRRSCRAPCRLAAPQPDGVCNGGNSTYNLGKLSLPY